MICARACDLISPLRGTVPSSLRELAGNNGVEYVDLDALRYAARDDSEIAIFPNEPFPNCRLGCSVDRLRISYELIKSIEGASVVQKPLLSCIPDAHHRCVRACQGAGERHCKYLVRQVACPDPYRRLLRNMFVKLLLMIVKAFIDRDSPSPKLCHSGACRKVGDIAKRQTVFKGHDVVQGASFSLCRTQSRIPIGIETYFQHDVSHSFKSRHLASCNDKAQFRSRSAARRLCQPVAFYVVRA